jgi:dienelactone hydrolase
MPEGPYHDRREAGRYLAGKLVDYAGRPDVLALALPCGVPVAYEVARALGTPLDVFLVRKLGVPGREEEEYRERFTRHLRFDIGLLARRLIEATDWLAVQPETCGLKVGYFGASTGGGAALVAAAERPEVISAVVTRGGRPDLASGSLARVRAPTLRIVGGADTPVIALKRRAMAQTTASV